MTTSDFTKSIWLWLLNDGGCWTANGLAEQMGKKVDPVFNVLSRMECRGMIKKAKLSQPRLVYFVDGTCIVPQGMAVAEVQAD